MKNTTDTQTSRILEANERRVLEITTRYMRRLGLLFLPIYLGNILGFFQISYMALTVAAVISTVILWLPTLAQKLGAPMRLRRYICVLGLGVVMGILAANNNIGIYMTYALAMVTSLIFFDKKFTLQISIFSYIVIVVSLYFRSFDMRQVEFDTNMTWWISRSMGYLIEAVTMTWICYNVANVSHNMLSRLVQSQQQLSEKNTKIENLSRQILLGLSMAVDAKDQYTNGHSKRVAQYSKEIARRMGKSEEEQENIYRAALLHDLGKIGISDEIINKTGDLTEEEYNLIKEHPRIGAGILEEISEVPALSIGAHWHHERYDGNGYPDGLAGEEIPEYARIICVADCYDAMSSNRSYRKALPQQKVRHELEKGMGTQFDPQIAKIMLDMMDEDPDYTMREE